MKHIYFFCLVSLLFFASTVSAQRGKNGALTVSATIQVNEYTTLTANAAIGNTSITVANSALNTYNRFSKNLAVGDLVMIIQMQGATILSGVEDSTWGNITAYNNCGLNELKEVASVPNGTTINFTCPLANNYTATGRVQVVRVPRYSTLAINNNGLINCDAWSGQTGGIIAIEVLGATTINGSLSADSLGFRGGAIQDNSGGTNSVGFDSNSVSIGAQKGEGIAGYQADYNIYGGMFGRGAPANGGGGGDQWNASGGGGGNGGIVAGYNGNGNPSSAILAWDSAWNLEYPGFANNISSGGGRGGYTIIWFPVGTPSPRKVPPGNLLWGSVDRNRMNAGGKGGRPLDYSTGRIFEGGGGGAGHEDQSLGGAGGNGGGIIYITSYGTISGNGSIHSNGGAGGNDNSNNQLGDGTGGGGCGGTIIINSALTISGIAINANGGRGGEQYITSNYECEGPGGGGGGGHIGLSQLGVTTSVSGGINGITTSPLMPLFPPDGATIGGLGDTVTQKGFIIIAPNDTICPNTSATLTATLSGIVPAGTTISWYDSITGGTLLGSGPLYTTPILTQTTVFYVSTCPGTYRQPDTVFVGGLNPFILSPSDSICKGDTILLIAGGGTTYLWSTNQTTDSIKVAPLITTTYTLTAYAKGCSGNKTITIFVRPPVTAIIHAVPDSICPLGKATILIIAGGEKATYKWNTGGTYDTIHVNPAITSSYTVNVYGTCDTTQQIIKVYVIPLAKPVITGTRVKCLGVTDTLHVSGGFSYLWTGGSTSSSYITGPIDGDSMITVTAYNSVGCSKDTTFNITIRTLTVVAVPPIVSCTGSIVTLRPMPETPGTGAWNYKWSPGGLIGDSITVNDSTEINYTLTISNASGCVEEIKTSVTPYNPPLTACCDKIILRGDDTVMVAYGDSIKNYTWSPAVTCLNPPLCNSVKVSPTVTTAYTVVGTDASGCQSEKVITIEVEDLCADFIVPNVFTPTNSGIYGVDNMFYIKTTNLDSWSLAIYDRWGKEEFKTSNPKQYWDGNSEGGGKAPDGVYYYIINGICQGNNYKKDGFVQLIR